MGRSPKSLSCGSDLLLLVPKFFSGPSFYWLSVI
uniref:Uncharacterized protein n=1 Tax=Rhizophora mucronata TaxID=61149 RepID=A0A2P2NP71_RHIMU